MENISKISPSVVELLLKRLHHSVADCLWNAVSNTMLAAELSELRRVLQVPILPTVKLLPHFLVKFLANP